jgi:hypothetical protein
MVPLIFLGTPIHRCKPLEELLTHLSLLSLTHEDRRVATTVADPVRALKGANSYWTFVVANPLGHTSPNTVLEARGGRW